MNYLLFLIKKANAKFHLKYLCPRCPKEKSKTRDILNEGECFWHKNWRNNNYKIQSYIGYKISKKIRNKK